MADCMPPGRTRNSPTNPLGIGKPMAEGGVGGEDAAGGGGGLGDGVGGPAVEREGRDLNRGGEKKGERGKPEGGGVAGHTVGGGEWREVWKREGACASVGPERGGDQD